MTEISARQWYAGVGGSWGTVHLTRSPKPDGIALCGVWIRGVTKMDLPKSTGVGRLCGSCQRIAKAKGAP